MKNDAVFFIHLHDRLQSVFPRQIRSVLRHTDPKWLLKLRWQSESQSLGKSKGTSITAVRLKGGRGGGGAGIAVSRISAYCGIFSGLHLKSFGTFRAFHIGSKLVGQLDGVHDAFRSLIQFIAFFSSIRGAGGFFRVAHQHDIDLMHLAGTGDQGVLV